MFLAEKSSNKHGFMCHCFVLHVSTENPLYCDCAAQSARRGGGVPFHLALAKTPTLNNCRHCEVGREASM